MGAPLPVQMRIISYNTHLFLDTVAVAFGETYEERVRLAAMIQRIAQSGADIVGLSEIWADSTKKSIVTKLRRIYPYSYYEPNTSLIYLASGLLILSKHPLSDCSYTVYTDLVGEDRLTGKGFYTARATIPTPAGKATMLLMLTHTQASSDAEHVAARTGNIKQLAKAIRGLPAAEPLVLMGDLNICGEVGGKETGEYVQLKTLLAPYGLQDVCRVVHPSAATEPMYTYDWFTNMLAKHFAPEDKVSQRLDYIFARGLGVAPTNTEFSVPRTWTYGDPETLNTQDLSDHFPLLMTVNPVGR